MIIAHVCPYYTPTIGGVKQVVEELSKRQVKMGNEVHVFTSDWDKERRITVMDEVIDGVQVHRCKHHLRVSKFSTVWPSVYKKLLELKPNIIHAHVTGHLHPWLAKKAAKKLNSKFIITPHCPWESKRSLPGTIANWISYKFFPVLKHADAVIAITPWEEKFLLKEKVKPENIHVIPNGMSAEFFEKVEPNKFKEKHNIPKGHKIVLFFGRLNVTKNPEMFVEIASAILRKRKDTKFIICGPNEGQFKNIKEKISNLPSGIKMNIKLLPPMRKRHDIIEMYQASDIYLLPSRREGAPLTQKEAYASGLPVVASRVNGVPFELEEGINGFLLKSEDTKGFVDKVELLLNNDSLRLLIAQNNKIKSKSSDWSLINNTTMNLYKNTKFTPFK